MLIWECVVAKTVYSQSCKIIIYIYIRLQSRVCRRFSFHPHTNLVRQWSSPTLPVTSEPGVTQVSCGRGPGWKAESWASREAVQAGSWLLTDHSPAAKATRFCVSFCFQSPSCRFSWAEGCVGKLLCFLSWPLGCREVVLKLVGLGTVWTHPKAGSWAALPRVWFHTSGVRHRNLNF